jgi:ribosome-binding protein aMBF1 (putative translation factor)
MFRDIAKAIGSVQYGPGCLTSNLMYRGGARHPKQGPGNSGPRSRHGARTNARLAETKGCMKKTNFDRYLEGQMRDPAFVARFEEAGEAWDIALQIAALREEAGLSQKDLARKLKTSQQQISRLESPGYEGHSLRMLRRLAKVLHARVRVVLEPQRAGQPDVLAEDTVPYRATRKQRKAA